jgi:hypothetical protein
MLKSVCFWHDEMLVEVGKLGESVQTRDYFQMIPKHRLWQSPVERYYNNTATLDYIRKGILLNGDLIGFDLNTDMREETIETYLEPNAEHSFTLGLYLEITWYLDNIRNSEIINDE